MTFLDLNKYRIEVGEALPAIDLIDEAPPGKVNISDLCRGKKALIIGVVGAFVPWGVRNNFQGLVAKIPDFKRKGFQEIICVAVNDVFIMQAWAAELNIEKEVRMLADPNAEFTKAIGLETHIPYLGGIRSKGYTMVVEDNILKQIIVENEAGSVSSIR